MIDRKKGPIITTQFDLTLRNVHKSTLDNGIRLYEINEGTQSVVKIELIFDSGRIYEQKIGASKTTAALIREGSTSHTGKELAYVFDYYGAVVRANCDMEHVSVSIVVLERHLREVWHIFYNMVFFPLFAEEEVAKITQLSCQKLKEQISNNDIIGYRALTEQLFGESHPYGYNTDPEHFLGLTREDILEYYNQNFGIEDMVVIIAGKYSTESTELISSSLSDLNREKRSQVPFFDNKLYPPIQKSLPTQNKIQASIKIGRRLFDVKHPDFRNTKLLSIILGGYFGSRLMKNIREEKGYTYGIYSSCHGWKYDGFIYVSAEVDNEYIEPTIKEIHKEFDQICNEPIPDEELAMIKTYINGQALHHLDGPFAKAELMKRLAVKGFDSKDYQNNLEYVNNLEAYVLKEIAQKYFSLSDYTTIVTGGDCKI